MANSIKKSARKFLKKYKVKNPTVRQLTEIIRLQGYKIIKYSKAYNDENIEILISSLNLQKYTQNFSAFTYTDNQYRIVFLEDGLSEDESLILLAHEEGHIFLEHFGATIIVGKNIRDEYEANEFAHYILNPSVGNNIVTFILHYKKTTVILGVLAVLIIGTSTAVPIAVQESRYYGEYYVSPSGERYHKKNCYYIKDKNDIRRVTKEEIENNEYTPCKVCLPELGE